MNSPRRGSLKTVFFWLSFFIIALLVIATSTVATRVYHVDAIRDLEVVAAAPEALVRQHLNVQDQVAALAAADPRRALPGHAHARSGVHAGWNLHA